MDKRQLLALAEGLTEQGMGFVAADFFGHGDTGGDHSLMTYARWTSNLADVMSWLRTQAWAKPDSLGCLGFSSGASAALRYAVDREDLTFVVSLATVLGAYFTMHEGAPVENLLNTSTPLWLAAGRNLTHSISPSITSKI